MAYKKLYRKTKTTPTVRQVATKALSLAKKAITTEETKFSDIGTIGATVDNTADCVYLTPVIQGIAVNNRIGNKIAAVGFQFNYWAVKSTSATNSLLRIVFVHDTQTVSDGTTISWTNVFTEEQVTAQRNTAQANKRYRIIYDAAHNIDAGDNSTQLRKKFIPFKHPIMFNGTTGTDIQKNAVYMLTLSNEATNAVQLIYSIRFMFKDS